MFSFDGDIINIAFPSLIVHPMKAEWMTNVMARRELAKLPVKTIAMQV